MDEEESKDEKEAKQGRGRWPRRSNCWHIIYSNCNLTHEWTREAGAYVYVYVYTCMRVFILVVLIYYILLTSI